MTDIGRVVTVVECEPLGALEVASRPVVAETAPVVVDVPTPVPVS